MAKLVVDKATSRPSQDECGLHNWSFRIERGRETATAWREDALGINRILECFAQLGIVERTRDKRDARAKIVRFTRLGLEWLKAFKIAVEGAEREMRDEIGLRRTDAIAAALNAYGQRFDRLGSKEESA